MFDFQRCSHKGKCFPNWCKIFTLQQIAVQTHMFLTLESKKFGNVKTSFYPFLNFLFKLHTKC